MINNHDMDGQPSRKTNWGLRGWYYRNRPAIKAAAIFWLFFLALSFITLFTGWASLTVTMLLQAVVCFFAGLTAAWLHHREKPAQQRYIRLGILTGVYLCLTTLIIILLFAVITGLGSLGLLIPIMIPYFFALPGELLICMTMGAAGSGLYSFLIKK